MKKKLLALLLALCMAGSALPVLAAEADQPAPFPQWAVPELADGYAMALFGDELTVNYAQTITEEQVDALARAVGEKLALLELPARAADDGALVIDTTRGGVINALYQEAAAYDFPGAEVGAVDYLVSLGVLCGDENGLSLDRTCSVVEAAALANRLVLALYDGQNAGSLGLLWKAEGKGNTLYLLGSVHVDRNNIYPFHRQLRDIILDADLAAFELDFNDQAGLAEFAAMQLYTDGTTLADHVSPALYEAVVRELGALGMTEEVVRSYKAWALATALQNLAIMDESTGANNMAMDMYVNAKAANAGIPIAAVETYAFQGGIFDGLSPEYQEASLAAGLLMLLDPETMDPRTRQALTDILGEEAFEPATQEALDEQMGTIDKMIETWKDRDPAAFDQVYGKDDIINSDDELNSKLFTDRDPGMIAWADGYLSQEAGHTGLLVVGAGHMVGDTGIVEGLKDLGYTVQVVEEP